MPVASSLSGESVVNQSANEYVAETVEQEARQLVPRLSLFGQPLQSQGHNGVMFREAIAFPDTLDIFHKIRLLNISSTPQTAPRLNGTALEYLRKSCGRDFAHYPFGHGYIDYTEPYHDEPPAMAFGYSPTFQVYLYLVLPHGRDTASTNQNNTGGLTNKRLELLYDKCILPALEQGNPLADQRGDWVIELYEEDGDVDPEKLPRSRRATWAEAKAELSAWKRKTRVGNQGLGDTRDEYLQPTTLQRVWELIENCLDEEVKKLCERMTLVLHCKPFATEPEEYRLWQDFQQVWEQNIRVEKLKPGTRFTVDMHLGM